MNAPFSGNDGMHLCTPPLCQQGKEKILTIIVAALKPRTSLRKLPSLFPKRTLSGLLDFFLAIRT